jgi:hypothetical protein
MSVKEFLKQRAVNVVVSGHYVLPHWLDPQGRPRSFACRTSRVSPFRMMVDAPVTGRIGDRMMPYFGDFGQLEGRISDIQSGEFLLELSMTGIMRRKMADKLAWLEQMQKDLRVQDVRKQARIIPANPHALLTLADGSTRECFVIDVSVSGAAVSAELQPEIGTPLAVGTCIGRVVRHLPSGFAVQFVEPLSRIDLERRFAQPSSYRPTRPATAPDPAPDTWTADQPNGT